MTSAAKSPGVLTPAPASIRLAGQHFAAATLYLLAGAAGVVWIAPALAAGAYLNPRVAGVTHLFTLGWLTTAIFGALYQFLPVALGVPVRSVVVAQAGFWTFVPGVALFAVGIATGGMTLRHAGITLVGTGVVLAGANFAASLARARTRDVTWAAVALALTFLASTLGLGILLLHNLHTGFIAATRLRVLATHLHVAIVGWVLIMIVGISHRLLPMFLLAHGADTRWTRRALALLAAGVAVLGAGLVTGRRIPVWTGALLLEGGLACFLRQAGAFYHARMRRDIDVGLRFAAVALAFLAVSAVLGPAALAGAGPLARVATAYVAVGLLGGVVLYVAGMFYKIVPLLAWTARFRDRMGRQPVPAVAQLYSARLALVQLGLMTAAIVLLTGGILAGSVHAARCGAVLLLAGVLVFALQLARVVLGRPASAPLALGGVPTRAGRGAPA
ncbi:MAG TPA: hypothetical protein VFW66_02785 [Gemmatimonadales bacterium]|nr:hypothetical protein [Gemmatimonadales bacterium]